MKRLRLLLPAALVVLLLILVLRPPTPQPSATTAADPSPEPALEVEVQPAAAAMIKAVRPLRADSAVSRPGGHGTRLHPSGVLHAIGVDPGWTLGTLPPGAVPAAAREFILARRAAWGLHNPRSGLSVLRHRTLPQRDIVRLQQTYADVPVFAAQFVAHVRDGKEVECVVADQAMTFLALDSAALPLRPQLDAAGAVLHAMAAMQQEHPLAVLEEPSPDTAALVVYAPGVLGLNGDAELAWDVTVSARPDSPDPAAARWIISAGDGMAVNRFPLKHSALTRRVFDYNNTNTEPSPATRGNGAAATGDAQVDNAYDFAGQVYDFFMLRHGRDSYNGSGGRIDILVRFCPNTTECPFTNATSGTGTGPMAFGDGYVTDDILAHEFMHKVTEFESGLLYQNASGAMNEAFSDIWGEIFDQSNGSLTPSGTDTTANRWLLGEDLTGGAVRNMSDPPAFNHPSRTLSPIYRAPVTYPRGGTGMDSNDNGGVHANSGVGNKLCFLLADGGTFNGVTVSNLGVNTTLDLFYEANTNFLTPGSDWLDLNFAMRQAAVPYGTAVATNVGLACDAVNLNIAVRVRHLDRGTFAINRIGIPEVVGSYGPYRTFAEGLTGVPNGGTLKVQGGGGMVPVDPGFTLTQPMTIRTYDPYQPPTGTANPPTPFDIRVP